MSIARSGIGTLGIARSGIVASLTPSPTPTPTPSALASPIQAVLTNWNPATQFTHATTAFNAVVANTGRMKVAFAGDSTTLGFGGAFPATTDFKIHSAPAACASSLTTWSGGVVAGAFSSMVGDGAEGNLSDARVTFTGDGAWTNPPTQIFGGFFATCTSGGSINFVPSPAFNRVRVVYSQTGSFKVGVDGGALDATAAVTDASTNMATQTWSVTRGTHTVNVVGTSVTPCLIQSIECFDNTAFKVDCLNGGIGGAYSTVMASATTGQTVMSGLLAEAPDLTFINFGINDGQGTDSAIFTSGATFQSNISKGVSNLKDAGSDVVLVVTTAIVSGSSMESTYWNQYRDALLVAGTALNVPVLNLHAYYPDEATQAAKSPTWMSDGLHPSGPFYTDIGNVYAQILLAGVGQLTSTASPTTSILRVAHATMTGSAGGGTTAAINTTGATILIMVCSNFQGVGTFTPTDSRTNAWTTCTPQAGVNGVSTIFYAINPSVGTGHTFTYPGSFGTAEIMAFSGIVTVSPFDTENAGVTVSGTTQHTGSVTPAQAKSLIIAGMSSSAADPVTIDSGFTISDQSAFVSSTSFACAAAYLIQSSASAVNPLWTSIDAASDIEATIAVFKGA